MSAAATTITRLSDAAHRTIARLERTVADQERELERVEVDEERAHATVRAFAELLVGGHVEEAVTLAKQLVASQGMANGGCVQYALNDLVVSRAAALSIVAA